MREIIEDEVFGLGASSYAKDGYIPDSWLWYRQYAVEKIYLEAVKKEIFEAYL